MDAVAASGALLVAVGAGSFHVGAGLIVGGLLVVLGAVFWTWR